MNNISIQSDTPLTNLSSPSLLFCGDDTFKIWLDIGRYKAREGADPFCPLKELICRLQ